MMNFGWQLRGVFVKTNLQSNTKLVRKNLFSEIKQKLIFSYQLFKKFKIIFIHVSFIDCAVGVRYKECQFFTMKSKLRIWILMRKIRFIIIPALVVTDLK